MTKITPPHYLIACIIPCYNASEYVKRCLKSIFAQDLQNIEIICVDDCSTDDTYSILQTIAAKESRLKIVKQPTNQGPYKARNRGIELAAADYIVFIDADDWIAPNYLSTLYKSIKQDNVDLVITNSTITAFKFGIHKKSCLQGDYFNDKLNKPIVGDEIKLFKRNFFGCHSFSVALCGKIYRKSVLIDLPDYPFYYAEDMMANLFLFTNRISSFKMIDYAGYYYRSGGSAANYGSGIWKQSMDVFYERIKYLDLNNHTEDDIIRFLLIEMKNIFITTVQSFIYASNKANALSFIEETCKSKDFDYFRNLLSTIQDQPNLKSLWVLTTDDYGSIYNLAKKKITFKSRLRRFASKFI